MSLSIETRSWHWVQIILRFLLPLIFSAISFPPSLSSQYLIFLLHSLSKSGHSSLYLSIFSNFTPFSSIFFFSALKQILPFPIFLFLSFSLDFLANSCPSSPNLFSNAYAFFLASPPYLFLSNSFLIK